MRIKDQEKFDDLSERLANFQDAPYHFVGLDTPAKEKVLIAQLVDSIRRIDYLGHMSSKARSTSLYTPFSGSFQPLGGSAVFLKEGRYDDSYWLTYLATHFGKHKDDGWNLTEDFYGRFGQDGTWDWESASQDPEAISRWLEDIYPAITGAGRSRRFGNHRKFETLKPGPKGTGHALATYVTWIKSYGSHQDLINSAQKTVGQNPEEVFAFLYRDLEKVAKLGRLGKFDFLCNLTNLGISPIFPDKAYIAHSTGPKAGAKLLFGEGLSNSQLEDACVNLADHLRVSPQAVEDALCNWQKSPSNYIYFRG